MHYLGLSSIDILTCDVVSIAYFEKVIVFLKPICISPRQFVLSLDLHEDKQRLKHREVMNVNIYI